MCLGADEAMVKRQRLSAGELQDLLRSRREPHRRGRGIPAEGPRVGRRTTSVDASTPAALRWAERSAPRGAKPLEGAGSERLLGSAADLVEVHPDGAERRGVFLVGIAGPFPDDANDVGAYIVALDAEAIERPARDASRVAEEREQQVLGPDVVVTEVAGLLACANNGLARRGREPLEHGYLSRRRRRRPACFL
jgi:hypothetical protein